MLLQERHVQVACRWAIVMVEPHAAAILLPGMARGIGGKGKLNWLALLLFVVSNVVAFFLGRHFPEPADIRDAPFRRLHDHIAVLEAALKEASRGAPVEQTKRGLRVGDIEIKLITGGRQSSAASAEGDS